MEVQPEAYELEERFLSGASNNANHRVCSTLLMYKRRHVMFVPNSLDVGVHILIAVSDQASDDVWKCEF